MPRRVSHTETVMADRDDDALGWGDEIDDPTHVDGVRAAVEQTPGESTAHPSSAGGAASSTLLVIYGVLGGVYLLYVVGWVLGIRRDTFTAADLFFEVMYQFGEFLAIVSPVLWFALTLLLTRGHRPVIRIAWLLIGALLLLPWPFVLSGGAA